MNFPNGFDDWQETHFEMVAEVIKATELAEEGFAKGNLAESTLNNSGRGGLYELAKELTNEFEKRHEGHQWDGEYFDAIEEFIQEKIYSKTEN